MSQAKWIWGTTDPQKKQLVLFRREASVNPSGPYIVRVSADTRYILYVNGRRVCTGPCKTDSYHRHYEEVDIAPYLVSGHNCLAVQVYRQPSDSWKSRVFGAGALSMLHRDMAGLWLLDTAEGKFSTDSSWRWQEDLSYSFCVGVAYFLGDMEVVDGRRRIQDWTNAGYNDEAWQPSVEIANDLPWDIYGQENYWPLTARPIPLLYERPGRFARVMRGPDLLAGPVTIAPRQSVSIELDAGCLTTAYLTLRLTGGKDAKIELLYAESYQDPQSTGRLKKLRDPALYDSGVLSGYTDEYIAGDGCQTYEPFFMRVFRFVRLTVHTAETPLRLDSIDFRETAYPLTIAGGFESDRPEDRRCFDVSLRTLQLCMHETYEDCPYYEQMQYIQDSMLEALYAYPLTQDCRLTEKAIDEFAASQLPNGQLLCAYPSANRSVIPGFSLLWISMLYHHYWYTGQIEFAAKRLLTAEKILQYFLERIDETGLAADIGYWEFIDWVDNWNSRAGTCMTQGEGYPRYNYVYNMMLTAVLREISVLCEAAGFPDRAAYYRAHASRLSDSLRREAFDSACADLGGTVRGRRGRGGQSAHAGLSGGRHASVPLLLLYVLLFPRSGKSGHV